MTYWGSRNVKQGFSDLYQFQASKYEDWVVLGTENPVHETSNLPKNLKLNL